MAINVFCQDCNKTYAVKDELAGKRGKCPHGHFLVVPKLESGTEPLIPSESKSNHEQPVLSIPLSGKEKAPKPADGGCPACSAALSATSVLCVNCGFDLRTGKKLGAPKASRAGLSPMIYFLGGAVVVVVAAVVLFLLIFRDRLDPLAGTGPARTEQVSSPIDASDGKPVIQHLDISIHESRGKPITFKGRVDAEGKVIGDNREWTGHGLHTKDETLYLITVQLAEGSLPPPGSEVVITGVLSPTSGGSRYTNIETTPDKVRYISGEVNLTVTEARILSSVPPKTGGGLQGSNNLSLTITQGPKDPTGFIWLKMSIHDTGVLVFTRLVGRPSSTTFFDRVGMYQGHRYEIHWNSGDGYTSTWDGNTIRTIKTITIQN